MIRRDAERNPIHSCAVPQPVATGAHLDRAASTDRGEDGDRGSERSSGLTQDNRQAAAVDGGGGAHRATCEGGSRQ